MGRPKKAATVAAGGTLNLGTLNPKQVLFYQSQTKYTAYGGARGGGKTHVMRIKAVMGALQHPGISILIIRRTYGELQANHIEPILKLGVEPTLAVYNRQLHKLYFNNGSTITFGHFNSYDTALLEYQGQEFDWIFMDEATQFTEKEFRLMGGCLRGVNDFPKRFYLSCNPGGVGHNWVKRLFVDRDFKQNSENPEENEDGADYSFIQATVDDNTALMESEGGREYLKSLSQLPENIRAAHRYGDWNVLSGNYFPEFSEARHICRPFSIPRWWKRYRAFDYGLDMLACFWFAVDEAGRVCCYRELYQKNLVVSDAAQMILENTGIDERIEITFAPPDLWSRQKDTGKSMAELFMVCGLPLVKASNNRVQGWLQVKEFLKTGEDEKPGLVFFNNCQRICEELSEIQTDSNNPNDVAKEPHDITHGPDGLRYFCVSRSLPGEPEKDTDPFAEEDEANTTDYDEAMTGGEAGADYIMYG